MSTMPAGTSPPLPSETAQVALSRLFVVDRSRRDPGTEEAIEAVALQSPWFVFIS